ncbi:MAG: FecCD family ABC transporter permease [Stenotrophobium sp.]
MTFRTIKLPLLLAMLTFATVAAALFALSIGTMQIPLHEALAALIPSSPSDPAFRTVILELRLPRVVLALLIGAALAQTGAAMQALFRNPLADPSIVGVSSGAALAAVVVIVLGHALAWSGILSASWLLPAAAFGGGALTAWIVLRLSRHEGVTRPSTMLLAGLAVNAIAGAAIGLLIHMANDSALRSLTFWMYGSLGKADWSEIALAAPLMLVPLLWLPLEAHALNALLLGEAEAGHLGVDVPSLQRRVLLLVVLAVSSSVALAGIIGFVGLVVPHLVRLCTGPDHRLLLPGSAFLGAILLVLADAVSRIALAPAELPIGILTALIGGPFFLMLMLRYRGGTELS